MAPYRETTGDSIPQSTVARAISVRVFVLLAAAISLLFLGGSVFVFLHSTRSDGLTSQIEAQLDEMGVKPSTVELTSQKALRVRHAIAAGDFATANQISADVYAESRIQTWRFDPFESFVTAIFVETLLNSPAVLTNGLQKTRPTRCRCCFAHSIPTISDGTNAVIISRTKPRPSG
jgi:hypothetical protein